MSLSCDNHQSLKDILQQECECDHDGDGDGDDSFSNILPADIRLTSEENAHLESQKPESCTDTTLLKILLYLVYCNESTDPWAFELYRRVVYLDEMTPFDDFDGTQIEWWVQDVKKEGIKQYRLNPRIPHPYYFLLCEQLSSCVTQRSRDWIPLHDVVTWLQVGSIVFLNEMIQTYRPLVEALLLTSSNVPCHVVQWLQENRFLDKTHFHHFTKLAAQEKRFDTLAWARQNGPESANLCAAAASKGHLDVLQWLRENGAWWDETTCLAAAYSGHLDILQYADSNGCPLDREEIAHVAAFAHQPNVMDWVRPRPQPRSLLTCILTRAYEEVDDDDNDDVTQTMYEFQHACRRISPGSVVLVKSVPENNAPILLNTLHQYYQHQNKQVVSFVCDSLCDIANRLETLYNIQRARTREYQFLQDAGFHVEKEELVLLLDADVVRQCLRTTILADLVMRGRQCNITVFLVAASEGVLRPAIQVNLDWKIRLCPPTS